jgi:putative ABC transport system permease protein
MVPLGRKTLFQDMPRFLVAQGGVAFAVGLIAIEAGVYFGFLKGAVLPIEESRADLWVASRDTQYFELALPMRYDSVVKAAGVTGVERAEAMLLETSAWRGPGHKLEYVRVIGFDPNGELWSPGPVPKAMLAKLYDTDTAIVDASKLPGLNIDGIGGSGKIGQREVRVVGLTRGTQPMVSATFVYASLPNAAAYLAPPPPSARSIAVAKAELAALQTALNAERSAFSGDPDLLAQLPTPPPNLVPAPPNSPSAAGLQPSDGISYVLIKAKPGVDIESLKGRLTAELPDTIAYTKAEMIERTDSYWVKRTGIGFVLGLLAIVGLVVGGTVAGQILYTSVSEHIKEYGTLRAMGAPDSLFYAVVAEQAILLALLGFVPGIILSLIIAQWAREHRDILILVTPGSAAMTLAIITAMCIGAGIFAVQRALRVDPAIVFKA